MVLYSARSRYISQKIWVDSKFACFVRLSIVFLECYFKPFLCLLEVKTKLISGALPPEPLPGLCHKRGGLIALFFVFTGFLAPPDQVVLCSNNLGAFGATDVIFLSVPTPVIRLFSLNVEHGDLLD